MIVKEYFGKAPCGSDTYTYTLSNNSITRIKVSNYGATIVSLWVTDKQGIEHDIVCGYDDIQSYIDAPGYQGAVIGRVTNRISNARYTLDGVTYNLYPNCETFTLHGGKVGFDKRVWGAIAADSDEPELKLCYVSPDMEENFPGTLTVFVTYKLLADGSVSLRYEAVTDKKTIVNLTNHSYFNLEGFETASINDQIMWIDADSILDHDSDMIPSGKILSVDNTPYDFRTPKAIGRDFDSSEDMKKQNGGYDNNFIFKDYDNSVKLRCSLHAPVNGLTMKVYTNQPSVCVYTANMMNETDPPFKGGVVQKNRCAVCFETQKMSDSVNHPNFTDTTLSPENKYDYTTVFSFEQ